MRGRGSWAAVAVLHERRVVVFVIPVLAVNADGDVPAALFAAPDTANFQRVVQIARTLRGSFVALAFIC